MNTFAQTTLLPPVNVCPHFYQFYQSITKYCIVKGMIARIFDFPATDSTRSPIAGVCKKPKAVFYGNLNTDSALEFFSSCEEGKIWNIELNTVHLMDDSILSFFKKQEVKMRSLILNNYTVAPGLLKSIIESCENLVEFSLSFSSHFKTYCAYTDKLAIVFNDFKALQESGIICQSVTNFTFQFNILEHNDPIFTLTNKKFLDFFAVFPNVKKLDLTFLVNSSYNCNQFSTVFSNVKLDKQLSFSCIYYQLFNCLLYTSPSPRDRTRSRMPSSA